MGLARHNIDIELSSSPAITAHISTKKRHGTHTLEEFKLVKISSNVPQETRFTNKLRVSFLVCFDDSPLKKVLKGSSLA